jgi:hypothetical protein
MGEPASHGKRHLNAAPVGGGLNRAGGVAEPDREPIVANSSPKGIEHARHERERCRNAGGHVNVGCVPHGSFLWPEGVHLRQYSSVLFACRKSLRGPQLGASIGVHAVLSNHDSIAAKSAPRIAIRR